MDNENKKIVKSYERKIKEISIKLQKTPGYEAKTTKVLTKSKEKPKVTKISNTKGSRTKLNALDSPKSVKSTSKSKSKSKVKKQEESKFSISQNNTEYYSLRVEDTQLKSPTNIKPISKANDYFQNLESTLMSNGIM